MQLLCTLLMMVAYGQTSNQCPVQLKFSDALITKEDQTKISIDNHEVVIQLKDSPSYMMIPILANFGQICGQFNIDVSAALGADKSKIDINIVNYVDSTLKELNS